VNVCKLGPAGPPHPVATLAAPGSAPASGRPLRACSSRASRAAAPLLARPRRAVQPLQLLPRPLRSALQPAAAVHPGTLPSGLHTSLTPWTQAANASLVTLLNAHTAALDQAYQAAECYARARRSFFLKTSS